MEKTNLTTGDYKPKFLAIYLLEIVITFISGVMGTAISNYIIRDLLYDAWIAGIITSIFFLGFLITTLTLGHISDKIGAEKVLKFIMSAKILLNAFYLIPMKSSYGLVIFAVVYCFDGALNGIFWPTVQNASSRVEKEGGVKLRNKFTSGYNLSWNLGFLLGMIFGTIFIYFTKSNYKTFSLGLIGALFGAFVAWILLPEAIKSLRMDKDHKKNSKIDTEASIPIQNASSDQSKTLLERRLSAYPLYTIMIVILAHSLVDGAIMIILPVKILDADHWIFFLGLVKLIAQTISTTKLSLIDEKYLVRLIVISISSLFAVWFIFIFVEGLIITSILLIISGAAQGSIYALNMRLMSIKAKDMNSSKPFAYFQSMMSGGRMFGPLVIGFGAVLSINIGLWVLVIYDLIAIIQLIYNLKKLQKIH